MNKPVQVVEQAWAVRVGGPHPYLMIAGKISQDAGRMICTPWLFSTRAAAREACFEPYHHAVCVTVLPRAEYRRLKKRAQGKGE